MTGSLAVHDSVQRTVRPYWPQMDGLRAIGVLVVLASHLPPKIVGDGVAGVELFFVLSGFLITSLLLGERSATGSIGLRAFWARRAFRLVPALWATIAASAVLMAVYPDMFRALAADGGAQFRPLLWVFAAATWTTSLVPSALVVANPLGITWSLSIEEQFYLVWPLVFVFLIAGQSRRANPSPPPQQKSPGWERRIKLAISALVVLSALSMVLTSTGRFYYTTEMAFLRFDGIMAGCALALWTSTRGPVRMPAWLRWGSALLFVGAVLMSDPSFGSAVRFSGPMATLASVPLVLASTTGAVPVLSWAWAHESTVARAARDTFVWLGRRSYGLYLWHTVALRTVLAVTKSANWTVVTPTSLALALAATAASYRWIEQPFQRRQKALRRWT